MKVRELLDILEAKIAEQNAGDDKTTYADGNAEKSGGSTVGTNPPQNAGDDKTTYADGSAESGKGKDKSADAMNKEAMAGAKSSGKGKCDDDMADDAAKAEAEDAADDDKKDDDKGDDKAEPMSGKGDEEASDDKDGDDAKEDDGEKDDEVPPLKVPGKGKQEDGSASVGYDKETLDVDFVNKATGEKNKETKDAYKNAPEQGKKKNSYGNDHDNPDQYEVPAKDDPANVSGGKGKVSEGINWEVLKRMIRD